MSHTTMAHHTTSTILRIACSLSYVSQNSWLAVDAGTTPLVRAQELRFAWERFMADDDEEDPQIVREAIADSWRRSSAAGVDPTGGTARARSSPTSTRRTTARRSTRSPASRR